MAGVRRTRGPPSSSFPSSKLLLLLVAIPFTLAAFAFTVRRRGVITETGSGGESAAAIRSKSLDCSEFIRKSWEEGSLQYDKGNEAGGENADRHPTVCVTTTTSSGLDVLLPWIFYHKATGVSGFILFVEGNASVPQVSQALAAIQGVKVIQRTGDLETKQLKSRLWNESWFTKHLHKPCDYERLVRKQLNAETAISMAKGAGADWIIHLDTDELIHPAGAHDYFIWQILIDLPKSVDMVLFPTYDSVTEKDDIRDPFAQVSLFKKSHNHLTKQANSFFTVEAKDHIPGYFSSTPSGRSAARIQDGLHPHGDHRWNNYLKIPTEIKMEEAAILRYTYSRLSDLISRRDQCGCQPTVNAVKRCFVREFDRTAFVMAATTNDDGMLHWFQNDIVWTDRELKRKLIRNGTLTRIEAPLMIIQGLRQSNILESSRLQPKRL